jgi:hypothetical protein
VSLTLLETNAVPISDRAMQSPERVALMRINCFARTDREQDRDLVTH